MWEKSEIQDGGHSLEIGVKNVHLSYGLGSNEIPYATPICCQNSATSWGHCGCSTMFWELRVSKDWLFTVTGYGQVCVSVVSSRGKEAWIIVYMNPRPCKNLLILLSKSLIESHAIILSSKLFRISITRCANENFLISKRHGGVINFQEWPLVCAWLWSKNLLGSKSSKPLNILNTSFKSPLNLLVSKVVKF